MQNTYKFVWMFAPFIQRSQMFVYKCNGILCKSADQLDYSLECLQGISDNIPTLASHGMKFIKSIEFEGLFNKWSSLRTSLLTFLKGTVKVFSL